MKKRIVFSLMLISMFVFNSVMATDGHWLVPTEKLTGANTLIINADVTIVLVNNSSPVLEVVGNKALSRFISFERKGNVLVINAANKRDLTKAGVIYISANEFCKIQVNADANIRSLNTLQIPSLEVIFNGVCEFEIHNIGEVNIRETRNYVVEQNRVVRTIPASVLESKQLRGF